MDINKSLSKNRVTPADFIAYIEIDKGSKNKYEIDKETGLILLDRVLYTSTHYPTNYGFIPRTLSGDGDPLDVFVLCSQALEKMSLVRCYPIGVIKMTDSSSCDEKIIAIPFGDPQYNCYKELSKLPAHLTDEISHFLEVYKQLENKKVSVKEVAGAKEAKNVIAKAIQKYEKSLKNS